MTTNPFWIDSAPIKRFPALQKNIRVDVLVVGAGITGITTAYMLKKAGLTVALIERERVAFVLSPIDGVIPDFWSAAQAE